MCERNNAKRILKVVEFTVGTWFHVWGCLLYTSQRKLISTRSLSRPLTGFDPDIRVTDFVVYIPYISRLAFG